MLKLGFSFLLLCLPLTANEQIFSELYGEELVSGFPEAVEFEKPEPMDFENKALGYLDRFDLAFQANERYEYFKGLDQLKKSSRVNRELFYAWVGAELSLLSYNHPKFKEEILVENGFRQIRYFQGHEYDGQGFVAMLDGVIYVCFRGTEPDSFTDMISDIKFALSTFRGEGKVHTGFLSSYTELKSKGLEKYLNFLTTTWPDAPIIFCGHSLGGALATLAAISYPKRALLISIGSPRVGNRAFSRWYPVRGIRVKNLADPVTHLPPSFALTGGYRHVGEKVLLFHSSLKLKGLSLRQDASGTWEAWKNRLIGKMESLFDHAPASYAIKLRSALESQERR